MSLLASFTTGAGTGTTLWICTSSRLYLANYKGVGHENLLNGSLDYLKISGKATQHCNIFSLTIKMHLYPVDCRSCLGHYPELPSLSPSNIAVAPVLPPGHTRTKAIASVLSCHLCFQS